MAARSYEDLNVWQKAHQWVLYVYPASRSLPREEVYALTSQVRRAAAAVAVAGNIVEGFRRPTKADKARFYQVALASLDGTRHHLPPAHDLGYADTVSLRAGFEEAGQMLDAYTRAVLASDRVGGGVRTYGLIGSIIGGLSYCFSVLAPDF